jgi:hypothetical protein
MEVLKLGFLWQFIYDVAWDCRYFLVGCEGEKSAF